MTAWALAALAPLALLALLLVPNVGRAQPGREKIADVRIVGARTTPAEKLLTYVRTRKGMTYDGQVAQADLIALSRTGLVQPVTVTTEPTQDGRVIVNFYVRERPNVVREIVYKHAKHVSAKDLDGIVKVRKGLPLDKTQNRLACYEIQDYLKKKGYYFANVTLEEGYEDSHTRVVFNITEGPIVRVRSINFTGQGELANAARLRTQTETSRAFLGLPLGGVFNPAMIEGDVLKLKEYYRSNGYLAVHVSRELKFSDDFRFVDVLYHIREGTRFRVKDVTVEGTKDFPREQLASVLQVKKGEFYNENIVNADVRNLTDYGGWRGFPLKVESTPSAVPGEPGVVRVQYVVQERSAAHKVGQVIVVGNEVTQDRVIRRVLGLYPGQTLRYPELREAERNLARLNIFEVKPDQGIRPTVTVLDPDSPGEYKDVLVQVKETHTGSFMIGAGVNSDNGIVGSIVLNERNFDIFRFPTSVADIFEGRAFRGAGQELRIEAVPGNQLQRYTVTFREPFLFDRPVSLMTSGYYYDRVFNEYTETRLGGRLNLGYAVNLPQFNWLRGWTVSGGFRAEDVNVRNVPFGAPIDYTSVQGHNQVYAPRVGVMWDTRDSFMRPTQGGLLDMSYEQVFGSFTFPIFNVEGSRFFTLWQRPDGSGKHVLVGRSQVGVAGENAPVFERFFAGGFRSIRGYQFRGVGPFVDGYNVGGRFMWLNSLEYQMPIRANDQLYAVAFVDSGTVESDVALHNYRVSVGVGLRIVIPMFGPVPIALDFGFPVSRAPGDREQVFNFWFGMYR